MKQIIGLDRELKLNWLDLGASLAETTPNKFELRAKLMDALTSEIPAHFVRYKTCTVLLRTWLTVPPQQMELRNRGYVLLKQMPLHEHLVLHWGMLLLAYPFFRQVTTAIGRSLETYGEVSRLQASRKIVETWGERTTVKRAVLRVFQSLVEWNALCATDSADLFHPVPTTGINDLTISLWFIEVLLRARETEIPFHALVQAPEAFPFALKISLGDVTRSGNFDTFQQGPDLLVGPRLVA